MPASLECPQIECWQTLFDDTVAATERESHERHLESCPACQERLRRIDEDKDGLRRLGRRVGDPTAVTADPILLQILGRLHETKPPVRIAPLEPADLYFLQPSEQPGVLGTLGDYEVREVIGQGGMGIVLLAFEPALHRLVAIKVMAAALAGSATARRRFTREAQAAAAVCHDHVVAVHGVDATEGLPYLVMQYVAGESLQDRLDRTGPLTVEETVRIGLQTASGLAAAHAQGLIHRDIKPANLLLENGVARVKITDFGLARMADDVGLTQDGEIAGTPDYMAPEQARGETVDHRADLFSLGSVLYTCCTGVPPFCGSTALAVLRRVSDEAPKPIRARNPDVPAWLEAVIARLMAKESAERFQSATEVAVLLENYLAHLQQPTKIDAPTLPLLPRQGVSTLPRRRVSPLLWLMVPILLAAVGMLARLGLPGGGNPSNQAGLDHEKPRAPEEKDKQRKQDHLVVDLSAGIDKLPPALSLFGPNVESVVKADPQGWRFTLPAGRDNSNRVGLEMPRLYGDFAISLGYELLAVGKPLPKYGAGMVIRLWFDAPSSLSVLLSRSNKPDGQWFGANRILKGADGKEQYLDYAHAKATQSRGKLRLVRIGSQLQFLVAEEGQDYRKIQSLEIGTADVRVGRVICQTMYKPIALDVRWTELDIRADKIDSGPQPAQALDASVESTQQPGPKKWLIALALCVVILLSFGALGWWLRVRRSRRAAKERVRVAVADRQEASPAAAPALSFPCFACGKRLQAKTALAGKKVKCPQCGKATVLPSLKTPRSGDTAG